MTAKTIGRCAALVLALQFFTPALLHADSPCECPGSSYSPCHYNFPLPWRCCARIRSHWHSAVEGPPPVSNSYYEYRSHCPYAAPASQLGFPSIIQRSKLPSGADAIRQVTLK